MDQKSLRFYILDYSDGSPVSSSDYCGDTDQAGIAGTSIFRPGKNRLEQA